MKDRFRNFVDTLDTSGGHILVMLFLLIYFTVTVFCFDASWIQRLIDMAFGGLLKGLEPRRSTATGRKQVCSAKLPSGHQRFDAADFRDMLSRASVPVSTRYYVPRSTALRP